MSLDQAYHKKKVLITGGCGFIGKQLQKKLCDHGAGVFIVDKNTESDKSKNVIRCDICNYRDLKNVVDDISPEIVFHLAGNIDRSTEFDIIQNMIETNVVGTLNLYKSLRGCNFLQSIVVAGTSEEYGNNEVPFKEYYKENPVSPYSFSKVCASYLSKMLFNNFKLPVIVLRATLAYGPGQETVMFIPALITTLLRSKKFFMTSGEQTRDFIYIDDLVNAYIKAGISEGYFGEIFNVGSGKAYKIKDVACRIASFLKKESFLVIGAKDYRKSEIWAYCADISKAKACLKWDPEIGIVGGLKKTIEWYSDENR